ncbi:MAG: isoaspartyl peptidase/L-asparaginase [Chitinophagales bacterium]|nr:isoaspartyl peptidase/L-asparaginase [Chitinophagales bacterium]
MNIGIVVHGGAGTMPKDEMTGDKKIACQAALTEALKAGYKILNDGGNAGDAVEAAVIELENFSLFNAGRGSVFTNKGTHEMDASIMDGKNLMCGAVAGVQHIRNPIKLAKKVMLYSEHVLLLGEGAEEFAKQHKIEFADDDYFFTQLRYDQFQIAKKKDVVMLDNVDTGIPKESGKKFGTVGAVALDKEGNLAAATSTGGMTNKLFGRVGDSPIIGSGTYANNKTCAVSCTGHGEYFIQHVVAYDVSCLMEYKNYTLQQAAEFVVHDKLKHAGGEGGIIAIDKQGNISLPFNTEGMYRGWMRNEKELYTAIYV